MVKLAAIADAWARVRLGIDPQHLPEIDRHFREKYRSIANGELTHADNHDS